MYEQYLHQPREVSIETQTLCNAACTFCPYPTLERKGTTMPTAELWALIDQMREWQVPFVISPFKVNEPFLDKRLLPLCRDIIDCVPKANLRIFTNGSRFTADNVLELLDLPMQRVAHIWISLNEVDPVRYKETMKYVALEHVAEKIDILHKAWLRRVRHRVIVSRVTEVDAQLEATRRVEFEAYTWNRWPGFVPFHIKRDAWITYTQSANTQVPATPCARWWELSIASAGTAALCCMDGEVEYPIGNVNEKSLLDIYNQPFLIQRRKEIVSRADVEPCKRCTY